MTKGIDLIVLTNDATIQLSINTKYYLVITKQKISNMNNYIVISRLTKYLFVFLFSVNAFAQSNVKLVIVESETSYLKNTIEANASLLLSSINKAYYSKTKPQRVNGISEETYASLLSMWELSPFRCMDVDIRERMIKRPNNSGYEIRNISVFIDEGNTDEDKYQEIVLSFSNSGEINNVNIALESSIWKRLAQGEGNDVSELRHRKMILDFVENFRTSYNRKDINFLSKVFSEDALIITGRVIKVNPGIDGSNSFLPKEKIEYQKQTRGEYIAKMKNIFAYNSYINIKFDELEIKRHPKYKNIYGVTLVQDWNTTQYKDKGYVFLMIDYKDEDKPLIYVRTWQPEKFNGKILNEDEKFNIDNVVAPGER
jgi:hypothetical protein